MKQRFNLIWILAVLLLLPVGFQCNDAGAEPIEITFPWTAPGDDGYQGTATAYRLAYSQDPNFINQTVPDTLFAIIDQAGDTTWHITQRPTGGTEVVGLPNPQLAGSAETFTKIIDLADGVYYFAIWSVDEVGNWSQPSNVKVLDKRDVAAPGAILDLDIILN